MHDNGYPDDSFSFQFLFAHQDDHVDIEPADVAVFVQNVPDVAGHLAQEVVVFALDDRLEGPSHYHEHALLKLLSGFFNGLNQVREGEELFELV